MKKTKSNASLAKEIKDGRSNIRAINSQISSLKAQKAKETQKVESLVDSLTSKLTGEHQRTRTKQSSKKEARRYLA